MSSGKSFTDIELHYEVENIKYKNIKVWPLLKAELFIGRNFISGNSQKAEKEGKIYKLIDKFIKIRPAIFNINGLFKRNYRYILFTDTLEKRWFNGEYIDKIVSFFLRDLIDITNINLTNQTKDRHLLQPIDIWVRRTIQLLTNDQNMADNQIREWIVQESVKFNLNSERVNMGIWFFCSQIVKSDYRLKTIINNLNNAQNLVNNFRNIIKNVYQHC